MDGVSGSVVRIGVVDMQKTRCAFTFSILLFLISTFPFVTAQASEGPEIIIRHNGLCADGMIYWPRDIIYRIEIEVSDSDNVTTVFADITEQYSTDTYRVFASLSEGTPVNGVWVFTTSKFLSWEGGVFDILFTVWACDGLGNWNSALGYRSTGMGGSFLPQMFFTMFIAFLVCVLFSSRKRFKRNKEFQKTYNLGLNVE